MPLFGFFAKFPGASKVLFAFTPLRSMTSTLFHYACPQFRGDRGTETNEPKVYS